jgi:hypothetical protein
MDILSLLLIIKIDDCSDISLHVLLPLPCCCLQTITSTKREARGIVLLPLLTFVWVANKGCIPKFVAHGGLSDVVNFSEVDAGRDDDMRADNECDTMQEGLSLFDGAHEGLGNEEVRDMLREKETEWVLELIDAVKSPLTDTDELAELLPAENKLTLLDGVAVDEVLGPRQPVLVREKFILRDCVAADEALEPETESDVLREQETEWVLELIDSVESPLSDNDELAELLIAEDELTLLDGVAVDEVLGYRQTTGQSP